MFRHLMMVSFSLFLLLCPAALLADDVEPAGMTADQQAMMEAMMRAATPGEQHAELERSAGVWDAEVKSWMEPGAEPMVMQGVFHRELLLGGRVLQETFEGEAMGQPFHGFSLAGYDNVTGRWWTTWNDTMSTGLMVMWGAWSDEEGAVVYDGKIADPMSGTMAETRHVVRRPKDGQEIIEMYDMSSGKPVKNMEIVATRR